MKKLTIFKNVVDNLNILEIVNQSVPNKNTLSSVGRL